MCLSIPGAPKALPPPAPAGMTNEWKGHRYLPALIELGNKGSMELINQPLDYPRTQCRCRLIEIASRDGTGTVIFDA